MVPVEYFTQAIFYNIKNFLTFQLSTAMAALSIVAIATCMGFKCPINAMQVRLRAVFQRLGVGGIAAVAVGISNSLHAPHAWVLG